MTTPPTSLDHPTFAACRGAFPAKKFRGTEFRNQATLIVEPGDLLEVMTFLRHDPSMRYDMCTDVAGVDYLGYPSETIGRFAVRYNLISTERNDRFFVKAFLDPSIPTDGIEEDPALYLPSVCGLWPGAEWREREVFDMFGIRFHNHPDLRRILTWKDFPAHPQRKDYPVKGRGERERYQVVDRTDA
ncbi:MAG: NADH-quinone oxidoreductase subunit C [Phycisphaeraceae bacterium]|nr:NADH-quinone oxidoreductase subunit C [Phycisphaeraceae bacterium]MCB9848337.1 NADH-quinone oxidoreductase subunit C [Phycisphaeraceae bacterium]